MKLLLLTLGAILLFTYNPVSAAEDSMALRPGDDEARVSRIIDSLNGGDGLYGKGLNGFDIYDHLGYVYMGWRTTGGLWQNHIIGDYIMDELEKAGYQTTDEDVTAPYGSKSASDKSSATEGDYAWLIKYQETEEKELGLTWDPEFSSLEIKMVSDDGTVIEDPEAEELEEGIGGTWWAYNPMTEIYQKYFAKEFGMDYEQQIAPLGSTKEKIEAMHEVLMSSDKDRDSRTGVDDYTYIRRESIAKPNKEADLNKRTRLAWESDFTDPAGTDPSEAKGSEGELLYVGEVDEFENTNSEGISGERIRGSVILTDSTPWESVSYAVKNGAIGVATTTDLEAFLHPKDGEGNILEPWYDSSRYAVGAGMNYREWMDAPDDIHIVNWQFSYKQRDYTKKLLAKANREGFRVMARQIAIGQTYPMTTTASSPGEGQAVAIAEVKGSLHPEKRVLICAHVQEPGCCDNATGVASLLGMATRYKKLIDEGKIDRPQCTITFMWGDEMNMGDFWMDGHPEETKDLITALDMDMTGEDPEKTGGVMRIEKTPDPSALYTYTKDMLPWNDTDQWIPSLSNPYYDKDYQNQLGAFVRLPDAHTIWGSGGVYGVFKDGWYLNDLYMYVANTVTDRHDPDFRVEVCPYEGGSDHEAFLEKKIPALLAWHFTDYGYHSSSDTLYMASPRELESVSMSTLTTALMISDLREDEDAALDVLDAVMEAAIKRMDCEAVNTDHHLIYAEAGHSTYQDALAEEKEVLSAWGKWYDEALASVATLVDEPSEDLLTAIQSAKTEVYAITAKRLAYAEELLNPVTARSIAAGKIDEFLEVIDIPADLHDQVDAIVKQAKKDIDAESVNSKAAAIAVKAIQDIEFMLVADASAKVQELTDYKIKAQKEIMAYMKANRKYITNDLTIGFILDYVIDTGSAKNKTAVDAALKKAKAVIDKIVTAKKSKVSGLKITFKKRKAVIKWKKTAKVSGYQVSYKLKNSKKWKTLKTTKTVRVVSKKLKKGRRYQFKVRAFTRIQGKKVYGPYSKIKTKKCR